MKKLNLFLFLLFAAFVANAQTNDVSSLGSAITSKEGKAWITNYVNHYGSEHGIYYGKNVLTELISKSDVEGIYIVRGLDEVGKEVLMFRASDKNGILIHNDLIVGNGAHDKSNDISSKGTFVTEEMANKMAEKFRTTFEYRTPMYLYGKKGIETILGHSGTEGIRFINGLDEAGVEHLIFVGAEKNGTEIWTAEVWNHGSGIFSFWNWLTSRR